jgi:hypothetical protein
MPPSLAKKPRMPPMCWGFVMRVLGAWAPCAG